MTEIEFAAIIIAVGLVLNGVLSSVRVSSSTSSLAGLHIKHGLEAVARSIDKYREHLEHKDD